MREVGLRGRIDARVVGMLHLGFWRWPCHPHIDLSILFEAGDRRGFQ